MESSERNWAYHISFLPIPPYLQLISSTTIMPKCMLRSVLFLLLTLHTAGQTAWLQVS